VLQMKISIKAGIKLVSLIEEKNQSFIRYRKRWALCGVLRIRNTW